MNTHRSPLAPSRTDDRIKDRRGFGLIEFLVVLAIIALLVAVATYMGGCWGTGGVGGSTTAGTPAGSATISATRETVKVAIKNMTIAMAPVVDCSKAAALAADVAAAQAKINAAAKDYPADYAAAKSVIQQDVDNFNGLIKTYNNDCSATIPLITLPP